jgi:TRAP-type C4-dicarboxylate transport system permease small subunit
MNFRKRLDKILEWVLVIIFSILVLDVLWQVISRYVLVSPSSFTDELAGYLLIWTSILGAAYVAGKNEHLAIDLLLRKSGPSRKRILSIIIFLLIGSFSFFVMFVGGLWLVYTRFYLNVYSTTLQISLGYIYSVLPLGGLLIVYYTIDNLKITLKQKNN